MTSQHSAVAFRALGEVYCIRQLSLIPTFESLAASAARMIQGCRPWDYFLGRTSVLLQTQDFERYPGTTTEPAPLDR